MASVLSPLSDPQSMAAIGGQPDHEELSRSDLLIAAQNLLRQAERLSARSSWQQWPVEVRQKGREGQIAFACQGLPENYPVDGRTLAAIQKALDNALTARTARLQHQQQQQQQQMAHMSVGVAASRQPAANSGTRDSQVSGSPSNPPDQKGTTAGNHTHHGHNQPSPSPSPQPPSRPSTRSKKRSHSGIHMNAFAAMQAVSDGCRVEVEDFSCAQSHGVREALVEAIHYRNARLKGLKDESCLVGGLQPCEGLLDVVEEYDWPPEEQIDVEDTPAHQQHQQQQQQQEGNGGLRRSKRRLSGSPPSFGRRNAPRQTAHDTCDKIRMVVDLENDLASSMEASPAAASAASASATAARPWAKRPDSEIVADCEEKFRTYCEKRGDCLGGIFQGLADKTSFEISTPECVTLTMGPYPDGHGGGYYLSAEASRGPRDPSWHFGGVTKKVKKLVDCGGPVGLYQQSTHRTTVEDNKGRRILSDTRRRGSRGGQGGKGADGEGGKGNRPPDRLHSPQRQPPLLPVAHPLVPLLPPRLPNGANSPPVDQPMQPAPPPPPAPGPPQWHLEPDKRLGHEQLLSYLNQCVEGALKFGIFGMKVCKHAVSGRPSIAIKALPGRPSLTVVEVMGDTYSHVQQAITEVRRIATPAAADRQPHPRPPEPSAGAVIDQPVHPVPAPTDSPKWQLTPHQPLDYDQLLSCTRSVATDMLKHDLEGVKLQKKSASGTVAIIVKGVGAYGDRPFEVRGSTYAHVLQAVMDAARYRDDLTAQAASAAQGATQPQPSDALMGQPMHPAPAPLHPPPPLPAADAPEGDQERDVLDITAAFVAATGKIDEEDGESKGTDDGSKSGDGRQGGVGGVKQECAVKEERVVKQEPPSPARGPQGGSGRADDDQHMDDAAAAGSGDDGGGQCDGVLMPTMGLVPADSEPLVVDEDQPQRHQPHQLQGEGRGDDQQIEDAPAAAAAAAPPMVEMAVEQPPSSRGNKHDDLPSAQGVHLHAHQHPSGGDGNAGGKAAGDGEGEGGGQGVGMGMAGRVAVADVTRAQFVALSKQRAPQSELQQLAAKLELICLEDFKSLGELLDLTKDPPDAQSTGTTTEFRRSFRVTDGCFLGLQLFIKKLTDEADTHGGVSVADADDSVYQQLATEATEAADRLTVDELAARLQQGSPAAAALSEKIRQAKISGSVLRRFLNESDLPEGSAERRWVLALKERSALGLNLALKAEVRRILNIP
ncbi:unnamed protein product [Vitrella brassicaformis CCMP3155]|uniref:Uncharacterized protein n=2 Tax=Vitrella brassicaformis TaxID=1169539 RepID=A0A0G4GJH6_VITBC|nr:unnamed protein product [Vitrella brassicaformis CCMP3155]|eukprot:CEM30101.1 unnamed protein product [Vitrella brassicaformis CCMP3155]